MLANWLYPKERSTSQTFRTGGSFGAKGSTEVRLLLSHRNPDIGAPPSSVVAFQRDGSQVLEKDISGKRLIWLLKRFTCISKRDTELRMTGFLK